MNIVQLAHRIGVAIAGAALVAGVVLLYSPGIAESVPIGLWIADVGAVFSILLGLWVAYTRYDVEYDFTPVPDIEFRLSTPAPGSDIDDLIYRLTEFREGTIEYRQQVRERVVEIAIAVIRERQECSREQAIEQLEDGSWTDSSAAASFFIGGGASTSASSLGESIRDRLFDTESDYRQQLRTTVEAIETISDFDFDLEASEEERQPVQFDQGALIGADEGDRITDTVRMRSRRKTYHWTGITAFALLALAAGILSSQAGLLLASAIGIGLAGVARMGSPPATSNLEVTREVSETEPNPGDEIEATVTVENTGDSVLTDLTLIDRVPAMVEVVEGTARVGTALRPGGTVTFEYTAIVQRGEHEWPLQVIGRNVSSSVEQEVLIDAGTAVTCTPQLRTAAEMPVRLQTSIYSGQVETRIGGEGLEFHSIRDYHPGDPKRRIDWKSYARTNEFSTVEFRREHAARIVLLFDGRESSYLSPGPGTKHALDRSVNLAFDIYASLHDQGHLIGLAAFNGVPCWLGPGTGTEHLQRVRNLFVEHPALSPIPPDARDEEVGRYIDPLVHIRRQLPGDTQVFLFSPMLDEYTYEVARQIDGSGHLVTVLSPDPTAGRTIGQRIVRLERAVLIKRLRDHGIRVVDWRAEQPISVELEHAKRRWMA